MSIKLPFQTGHAGCVVVPVQFETGSIVRRYRSVWTRTHPAASASSHMVDKHQHSGFDKHPLKLLQPRFTHDAVSLGCSADASSPHFSLLIILIQVYLEFICPKEPIPQLLSLKIFSYASAQLSAVVLVHINTFKTSLEL